MIQGVVNANLEAAVTLSLRGESGQEREIEAVIDTDFNGFLTLPTALVAELGIPFAYMGRATLADGSEAAFDVYDATVLWNGQPGYVESGAVGADPLVGMSLLDRHDLSIQVRDGGRVVIRAGE